ncbi:MAG TPA: 30S ribosomal protein S13 [Candidatus Hydrogenedentes bacterium]|nr:30S ribosomal protein S13 [Candidatus Hydrogenedentota bacterium]HPG69469.1 30S ribosomal protein S13 [Candidatus Hydrogenedentota bacterium]
MARVVGVDLPREKRIEAGLQSVFGIGPTRAKEVLAKTGINPDVRVRDLTDEEVMKINTTIQSEYKVEGDLRREVSANIKRLMDINSYRGMRHKRGLPVNGQRTHTNARTRKGPKRVAIKKKGGTKV